MILIISAKHDGHINSVAHHLDTAGMPWIRLNTEDLALNVEMEISPTDGNGVLHIRDSGKTVELNQVKAVWYRKPEPVQVSHFSLEGPPLDYVQAELNEILHGLYALLHHVRWINDPFVTRIAHRKLLQLKTANDIGFLTPRTLVSNNAQAVVAFCESLNADIAIKSLGALTITERLEDGAQSRRSPAERTASCKLDGRIVW
jgi:hypothetical protein